MPITLSDEVIERLKKRFVDSCYGEEERLFQWYVAPFGADSEYAGAAQHYPLLERFPQAIQESGQRSFLILGDSGLGKTTLSLWLCHYFWANLATQKRLPIYIHLPEVLSSDGTLPEDILDTFLRSRFDEAERIEIRSQSLLLMLDGYDEITERCNIYTSNHWHEGQYDIKIVTSCRLEALRELNIATLFETAIDARAPATLATKYQTFYLQAFNEAQIKDYLRAFLINPPLEFREQYSGTAWLQAGHYSEWLERLPALKILATTPFLLSMIVQALPQMVAKHGGEDTITQANLTQTDIFEAFVNRWFSHQASRLQKGKQLSLQKDKQSSSLTHAQVCVYLKAYAQNLAASLLDITGHLKQEVIKDEHTLNPHLAAPSHDEELLGEYERAHKCRFANPDMVDLRALRAGCLLRTEGGNFRFLHKSLVEFLAARELFAGLQGEYDLHIREGLSSRESAPAFNRQLIKEPQMIARLVERVQANESFKKLLCQIVESSKEIAGISTMSANAITILNAARFNFSGLDLRDIQIPGADLSYALCGNTDFRGANLEGVSFSQARLPQARFQGANCANMYFGEKPFLSHPSEVNAVAHYNTPTDSYLLAGCSDGYVYQWHSQTQALYRTYNHGWSLIRKSSMVSCLAITYGGSSCSAATFRHYLATGGKEGNYIYIWSLQTGRYFPRLDGHERGVTSLAFSANGEWLASASADNTVRLWHMPDMKAGQVLKEHVDRVSSIAFSPNSEWLVSGSADNTVRLWHMPDGGVGLVLQGHTKDVCSVSFSPNGEWLASGSADNTVRLWHMPNGALVSVFQGHTKDVRSVSFSPNGGCLASGSADNTLRLWRMPDGAVGPLLQGHTKDVCSVSFSPNGELASASSDKTVRLWQYTVPTLKERIEPALHVHKDKIISVTFSPNGEWLASGSADNTVRLWHSLDGAVGPVLQGHTKDVCSLSFSPNGEWLVSGSADNTVRLWHMPDGGVGLVLQGHTKDVCSVSFSPNGEWLASGSADNTVRLWHMPDGAVGPMLQGHTRGVCSVSFSPNGEWLASGSGAGNTVRLWHMPNGALVSVFQGHTRGVCSVSFSPNGEWLVSRSSGRVQLWHMPSGASGPVLSSGLSEALLSLSFASNACWLAVSGGSVGMHRSSRDVEVERRRLVAVAVAVVAVAIAIAAASADKDLPSVADSDSDSDDAGPATNNVLGILLLPAQIVEPWHMPDVECLQIISLWYRVSSIAFSPSPKGMALAVAGENGDLSLISFINNEATQWRLNWTHGQPGLDLRRLHITQTIGFPALAERLCKQRGAEGQPAPVSQRYLPLYTLFQPIVEAATASNWVDSLLPAVNARRLRISEKLWCVSVAKEILLPGHDFLIIEGLKNHHRFVIRADLIQDKSKAVIRLDPFCHKDARAKHSFDNFKESVKSYQSNQWSITKEQGKKLLSNIRADQQTTIVYALGSMEYSGTDYHNCVSWCRKQLRQIGVNPPKIVMKDYVQRAQTASKPTSRSN